MPAGYHIEMDRSRNRELDHLQPVCCNLVARQMLIVLVMRRSSLGIQRLNAELGLHYTSMQNSALAACNHFDLSGLCIGSEVASEA